MATCAVKDGRAFYAVPISYPTKYLTPALTALFALALVATACGSSSDDAASPAVDTVESAVEDATGNSADSTDEAPESEEAGDQAAEAAIPAVDAPVLEPTEVPAAEAGELTDLEIKPVPPLPTGPVTELEIDDIVVGEGVEARTGASVIVRYVGVRAQDGIEFDSSWSRPDNQFPFTLGVGQVIPGWDEGVDGMLVGGRRTLTIPAAMAYGDRGSGADIPPNTDLVFVVDLLGATEPLSEADQPEFTIPDTAPTELVITDLVVGEGPAVTAESLISIQMLAAVQSSGDVTMSTWRDQFGTPIDLPLSASIPAFIDGMTGMQVGGIRQLDVPAGPDGLDENEAATVVVELVEILG